MPTLVLPNLINYMTTKSIFPIERIEKSILLIRGHRVMLDADLGDLYRVPTKRLNEQVKRNRERFPQDFMFRLTKEEVQELNRSQNAIGSQKHRDPRFPPYVFTEPGALMLANVLKSKTAVQASILVVRAFTRMRQLLASQKGLMQKILAMEAKYDTQFKAVFTAIRKLMDDDEGPVRKIGFTTDNER